MLLKPPAPDFGTIVPLYRLLAADFNTTADQTLEKLHNYSAFSIFNIYILNNSIRMSTAAGGFYTGAGKTGLTLVGAAQAYSVMTSANTGTPLTLTITCRGRRTEDPIFSLSTPQGAAATADIYVMGYAVV